MTTPVSVIIPTHNRADSIVEAVQHLLRQEYPRELTQIIVVTDRCDDDTGARLAAFGDSIRVLESQAPGGSSALNTGIAEASGEIALFLDDEMRAQPQLVAQHVASHASAAGAKIGVTGYSPVHIDIHSPSIHCYMSERYEGYHAQLASGSLRWSPTALNAANASIAMSHLRDIGGFNAGYFFQRNDFELAARLLERGFEFRYNPDARADQHLAVTTETMISRAEPRGVNDVRLAREFPWCVTWLPFRRQLENPAAAAKWHMIWLSRGVLPHALAWMRRRRPDDFGLVRFEYAARYAVSVIRALGGWRGWTDLARTSAQWQSRQAS
jgi:glycosyltransferase involved in cell wall biosynthesis